MNIEFANIAEILLHAVTAVGIIEWLKVTLRDVQTPKILPVLALPLVAVGIGFSTLIPEVMIGLRVWAIAQISYPLLVQLPERLIKKVG
jgi:hypothetical protein